MKVLTEEEIQLLVDEVVAWVVKEELEKLQADAGLVTDQSTEQGETADDHV